MSTAPVTLLNASPGVLGASYTTASVTPAANTRAVVFGTYDKASLLASKPTISDSLGTLTWTELGNIHTSTASNPDLWLVAWISNDLGASPAAMTVTVAATGGRAGTCSIITVLSADTNGTALQVASAEDLANGDPSFTFGSAPGANNLVVGCNWHGGGNAITKPTGYTSLYDNTPTNVASRRHEVFYDNTSAAQGPNQSLSGNIRSVVLAIELAPASGGAVNGSLAGTIDPVTQTATGTVTIQGSLAQTIAAVTQTTTGTLTIQGSLAQTIDPVTLAANGSAGGAVNATLNQTIGPFTLNASGQPVGQTGGGGGSSWAYNWSPKPREKAEIKRIERKVRKKVAAVISAPGILSGDLTAIVRNEVEAPQSWLTPELINLIVKRIEAQFRQAFIRKQQEDDEDDDEAILLVA